MQAHPMVRNSQPALAFLLLLCASFLGAQRSPKTLGDTQLRLWFDIEKSLSASDGTEYFRTNLLNSLIPGGTYGLHWLKGTVISSEVVGTAGNILVAISDKDTPEVALRVDRLPPTNVRIRKGAAIEFEGVGAAFTRSPLMLTLEVEACRQIGSDGVLRCGRENRQR